MKKLLFALFVLVATLCLGCGNQEEKVLRIGLMPDTDSLPFVIAQEKGYFDEEKVKVELVAFKSAMDRDAALQSGSLEGAVSDVLAAAFLRSGGFNVKITTSTDGSYKLVAGKEVTGSGLKAVSGKDIAISRNTIIEYVTDQMLAKENMTENSVEKVIIPQIPTRLEMLQNGKITAATLPEPMASVAVKNGAKLLASSDELGINPGIVLFTEKTIKDSPEEIKKLYRAYNKAVKYLTETKREDYIDLVVEKGGFPPDAKEALKLPEYNEAALPSQKDFNGAINWLLQKKLIKDKYAYSDLVTDVLK